MAIIISLRKVRLPCTFNHPLTSSDKRCETGDYHLADFEGLNDRITSSSFSQRRADFRDGVSTRDDDCCAITALGESDCDAAHIIPRCKGDEVPFRILL